jgi:flotillin
MVPGPLSEANKITMVSGPDGEVGAARLTKEVLDIMEYIPGVVKSLTGVELAKPL